MNEYVFYTFEGYTESPSNKECENIQLLGFECGKDKVDAKQKLVETRGWLKKLDFDVNEIESRQLLTEENKKCIKAIVEYLWKDEEKHFEESGCPKNHIYDTLKQLKMLAE